MPDVVNEVEFNLAVATSAIVALLVDKGVISMEEFEQMRLGLQAATEQDMEKRRRERQEGINACMEIQGHGPG